MGISCKGYVLYKSMWEHNSIGYYCSLFRLSGLYTSSHLYITRVIADTSGQGMVAHEFESCEVLCERLFSKKFTRGIGSGDPAYLPIR